ncbi:M14 family zinc carboxypeptidase [Bizionia sp. KMM 8389]
MKQSYLSLIKKSTLILCFLGFSLLHAQTDAQGLANRYLNDKGEVTFSFQINNTTELDALTSKVSILNYNPDTRTVYAWANTTQFREFERTNRNYQINPTDNEFSGIVMSNELPYNQNRDAYPLTFPLTAYPTYADYASQMQEFVNNHPDICELVDIGGTTEGSTGGNKRLLFIKLSDNIGTEEAEPKVMYTSSIHGDEITGYPLMLNLINYFITAYKDNGHSDHTRIKNLIDNSEVWINPMANPDGTYYNNASNTSVANARRANANGLDLNRNYPDNVNGPHSNGHSAYELETQHFVLAANFHGGIEVVNYPWDNTYNRHADDDWFIQVSREFADNSQANGPNGYMDDLDDGITHGADWYRVFGGRQDYMNYTHQCKEITIELSNTKLIPANQLVNHWNYNREAFIEYLIQGIYGFQGKIKDAIIGEPLEATVKLIGHDAVNSHTISTLPHGDFYRPVYAGTYDILIEADCYQPITLSNQTIANYQTVTLGDIQLTPLTLTVPDNLNTTNTTSFTTDAAWTVTTVDNYDLRYRELATSTWTEISNVSNPYTITGLSPNTTYEFEVKSYCRPNSSAYSIAEQFTTATLAPCTGSSVSTFPYVETFDSGLGLWTQGENDIPGNNYEDWTLNSGSTPSSATGPNDDFTGNGNYIYTEASNSNSTSNIGQNVTVTLISPCFDLTGYEDANFSFYYHMFGAHMGSLSVEISLDNGTTWNQLDAAGNTVIDTPILDGEQQNYESAPWLEQTINLSSYDNQIFKLRLSGTTGQNYLSDIAVDQLSLTANEITFSAPPTAICQNLTVQLDHTGNATISAADIDNGSTDDDQIISYDIDIDSFNCSNVGSPINVTLTVTDADAQTDTCTAIVTVNSPEAPVAINCWDNYVYNTENCIWENQGTQPDAPTITCWQTTTFNATTCSWDITNDGDTQDPVCSSQNISVELDIYGSATITANQIDMGSSDDCGIASITVSPETFNTGNIGLNNVTLTVTDFSGNSSQCTAVVTVSEYTLGAETFNTDNLSIQPNPFNNYIEISFPKALKEAKYDIKLFDINGRVLFEKIISETSEKIRLTELNNLQQGTYFIKVSNQKTGETLIKKLLKY